MPDKKLFDVFWEYKNTGHSQCEAKNVLDVYEKEEKGELVSDFGDPDEFDDNYDCDSGWVVVKVEEIK